MSVLEKACEEYLEPSQPWFIGERFVCWATHPNTPNWEDRARGRKYHISGAGRKTACNMLIADMVSGAFQHGAEEYFCAVCKGVIEQTQSA